MDLDNLKEHLESMRVEDAAKVIINLLEPLLYAVVRYEYYGSDDSLSSDELQYFATWEDYICGSTDHSRKASDKLRDGIQLVASAIIERHHGGWENDDGGHGKVDFIVRPPSGELPHVILKHWDYEQIQHFGGKNVY